MYCIICTNNPQVIWYKSKTYNSRKVENIDFLISSWRRMGDRSIRSYFSSFNLHRRDDLSLSQLIMLESLARDLVGQVLHVFLHLKSHNERHACDWLQDKFMYTCSSAGVVAQKVPIMQFTSSCLSCFQGKFSSAMFIFAWFYWLILFTGLLLMFLIPYISVFREGLLLHKDKCGRYIVT